MNKLLNIFIAAILCSTTQAHSGDWTRRDPVFKFSSSIGTDDELVVGSTGNLTTEMVTNVITETKARFAWRNDTGNQLFLDPFIRTITYPFETNDDEIILGVFGEYRHNLQHKDKLQLRLRGGLERSQDVFNRFTGQITLNKRSTPARANQISLRYRFRDQNDAKTFVGYDQHELRVSYQNIWTPRDSQIKRVSTTIYGDFRKADASRFDYTEVGARLQVQLKPTNRWAITGRAKGFVREYGQDTSNGAKFSRSDQQFSVELNARRNIRKDAYVDGTIGWKINKSNLASRDVSGIVARLGYSMVLR
jgi:hypothetical protein